MLGSLPVLFQHIYAYGQIRSARSLRYDGPAVFRSQFPHSPGPFRLVSGHISQFLSGYFFAYIFSKEKKYLISYRA